MTSEFSHLFGRYGNGPEGRVSRALSGEGIRKRVWGMKSSGAILASDHFLFLGTDSLFSRNRLSYFRNELFLPRSNDLMTFPCPYRT